VSKKGVYTVCPLPHHPYFDVAIVDAPAMSTVLSPSSLMISFPVHCIRYLSDVHRDEGQRPF
jgi:hypothetical protein